MIYNPWDEPPRDNNIEFAAAEYSPNNETSDPIATALKVIDQQSTVIKQLTEMLQGRNSG
jgi:hypothetical protein